MRKTVTVHRVLDPNAGVKIRPGTCALAVMTKAPRAGKVKTRLTPPLTPEEAAALNVCFLRDTSRAITSARAQANAQGIGVYTPVGEEKAYVDILPDEFQLLSQRGDGFGERLIYAAEDLFALGFHSLCLIDSDSPTVPESTYLQAAQALARTGDRMIFGPSDDGGYYLIGLKKMHRRLFEEIAWSSERVAAQTLQRAQEIGLEVEFLPTCYDVDDRATLRRLCDGLLAGNEQAPATKHFLKQLIEREGRERIWPNE
ncbi:MAG: TIGR04282 family arsenosugar biosynthesis glycosyltransferase [Verrucomicrobiota bacterium]|nr:TIGR04282 family arsenosugar biosynthesis glycosyltransferase [Verrucomicrobiota bacterium]